MLGHFFSGLRIRIHFIRIQHFRLNTNTDPDPGFMTKNWKKITAEKKIKFLFWSKTSIYLSLGLHKEYSSYRRSLQLKRGYPTLQNINFYFFPPTFVVIFALLDPDPDSESGSKDPIESGSATLLFFYNTIRPTLASPEIHNYHNVTSGQFSGSGTFWYGSGSCSFL